MPILMVCRASHIRRRFLLVRPHFGTFFEVAESLKRGSVSCVAMLARTSGNANVGYPTEALRLGEHCIIFRAERIGRVFVSQTTRASSLPASGMIFGDRKSTRLNSSH